MEKWECTACGFIYDPENGDPDSGIEPGTAFEDLPDDWVCPQCGVGKDYFHIAATTSLTLIATMMAIDRNPEAVRSLSLIAKKFADKLEPFVANFQVSLEPELENLREKTSEEDLERAKELRGSIFEL